MTERFDVVILGGGTAGCVLAARLSENPSRRVLLVEAGRDLPPGSEPRSIADPFPSSYGDPQFAWPGLVAETGPDRKDGQPRGSRGFVQGRIMGGSSSIMGMMASRGGPADYDDWRNLGAEGWGWAEVLPYFRKLERDLDFDGPLHGDAGPLPIRRHRREEWAPFAAAIGRSIEREGYRFIADYNGEFGDGLSALPMNNLPDRRVSTASGYLTDEVRGRGNLTILADTAVEGLVWCGQRVTGAIVSGPSERQTVEGREIVLSLGAIHSPVMLMRCGIGDASALRNRGIAVVLDRPGVGRNLFNHVIVHLAVHLPRRAMQSSATRAWAFNVLRFSSGLPDCPQGDMHLFPNNKASWHPLGLQIGALGMGIRKPFSVGDVSLANDPNSPPLVRFNILDDERDLSRMVEAVQLGCRLLLDPEVRGVRHEVFLPSGGQANRLNRPSLGNYLQSLGINALFNLSPAARRFALRGSLIDPATIAGDRTAARDLVLRQAAPVHHACGTCRMGAANDPAAVTDQRCRVIGVDGLRVVDASVMPSIVSANTHLPVVMIAEKAAAMIDADQNIA